MGNTFVWAAKDNPGTDYLQMQEDVKNPENNACFVRVTIRNTDSKVKTSDFKARYFKMGDTVTCGEWLDSGVLKDRVLDASKSSRVWGTVAATVGGAGIGVGAMELFGNKLIGGAVEGQKDEDYIGEKEVINSNLLKLKNKNEEDFRKVCQWLEELNDSDGCSGDNPPKEAEPYCGISCKNLNDSNVAK